MSFAELERSFQGAKQRNEESWKQTRLIAYEVFRKDQKHPPPIDNYLQIGEVEKKELSKEYLDEVWQKYDKC